MQGAIPGEVPYISYPGTLQQNTPHLFVLCKLRAVQRLCLVSRETLPPVEPTVMLAVPVLRANQ